MNVEVRTTQYEFSHGRAPRGTGTWAFQVGATVMFFTGSYTWARREVTMIARRDGIDTIEVLP